MSRVLHHHWQSRYLISWRCTKNFQPINSMIDRCNKELCQRKHLQTNSSPFQKTSKSWTTHKKHNYTSNSIPVSPSLMRSDFPFRRIVTPPILNKNRIYLLQYSFTNKYMIPRELCVYSYTRTRTIDRPKNYVYYLWNCTHTNDRQAKKLCILPMQLCTVQYGNMRNCTWSILYWHNSITRM